MTKDELMALADAYAYQKALINVSQMLHSQILETDEARAALEAALDGVCRDAERYRRIYADQIEDKETLWDAALRVDNGGQP